MIILGMYLYIKEMQPGDLIVNKKQKNVALSLLSQDYHQYIDCVNEYKPADVSGMLKGDHTMNESSWSS